MSFRNSLLLVPGWPRHGCVRKHARQEVDEARECEAKIRFAAVVRFIAGVGSEDGGALRGAVLERDLVAVEAVAPTRTMIVRKLRYSPDLATAFA